MLAQITAPHFCAGLILDNDIVIKAAPIIKYMVGWSRDKVRQYCAEKRWTVRVVENK